MTRQHTSDEAALSRVRTWPKAVIPLPADLFEELRGLSRSCGLSFSKAMFDALRDAGIPYLKDRAASHAAATSESAA